MCVIKHMQKAAQKTIMVSEMAMKRKILSVTVGGVVPAQKKNPNSRLHVRSEMAECLS